MVIGESGIESCNWCHGRGMDDFYLKCHRCEGTGFKGGKEDERKFEEYIEKKTIEAKKVQEQYLFQDKLNERLTIGKQEIANIDFQNRLKGFINFSDESFYYDFEKLFEEYQTNPNVIEQFAQDLLLWKKDGEGIREIYQTIINENNLDLKIKIRLYGSFSYTFENREVSANPIKLTKGHPVFVNAKNKNSYTVACCLHEVGHHMEHRVTNLNDERITLIVKLKRDEISELDFIIQYRQIIIDMEYSAWERARKLKHPFKIDEKVFERVRAYCLSTYDEEAHEIAIRDYKQIISKKEEIKR